MKKPIALLALATLLGVPAPASAQGFRDFLGRLNPARMFERATDRERPETAPTLDDIRERLEARGLTPEQIDERIAQLTEIRQRRDERMEENRDRERPDLERLRTRLEEQGLTPEQIDERIAKITDALQRRRDRHEDGHNGQPPNFEMLRAKLEERGIDTAVLDERIARITEARQTRTRPSFAGRDDDAGDDGAASDDGGTFEPVANLLDSGLPSSEGETVTPVADLPVSDLPSSEGETMTPVAKEMRPMIADDNAAEPPEPDALSRIGSRIDLERFQDRMAARGLSESQIDARLARIAGRVGRR